MLLVIVKESVTIDIIYIGFLTCYLAIGTFMKSIFFSLDF